MVKKKKQLIKRIILFIVISLISGFGIYSMNAKMLMNDQMPMPLGFGVGVVMSGSMEPELSVDDLIFVVKDSIINDKDFLSGCHMAPPLLLEFYYGNAIIALAK